MKASRASKPLLWWAAIFDVKLTSAATQFIERNDKVAARKITGERTFDFTTPCLITGALCASNWARPKIGLDYHTGNFSVARSVLIVKLLCVSILIITLYLF